MLGFADPFKELFDAGGVSNGFEIQGRDKSAESGIYTGFLYKGVRF